MHVWGQPQLCGHQVFHVLPLLQGEGGAGTLPLGAWEPPHLLISLPPPSPTLQYWLYEPKVTKPWDLYYAMRDR